MKLWKILVATMIALLLVCAVAMAESTTCDHQWSDEGYDVAIGEMYSGNDGKHYNTYVTVYRCEKCTNGTKQSASFKKEVGTCNYGDLQTVEATCTTEGYTYRVCKVCGFEWRVSTIAKTQHETRTIKYEAATCLNPQTWTYGCVDCDWVDYFQSGNTAACVYEVKTLVKATCKTKGETAEVCKWCGTIKNGQITVGTTNPDGHDWNKVEVAATCTTKGFIYKDCKLCGVHGEDVVSEPLGHHYDYSKETVVKPTCTAGGYSTAPCHRCGEVITYGWTSATHTNKQFNNYKPATCSTAGYQAHYICYDCGTIWDHTEEKISAVPTIPANGKHILPQNTPASITDCTATNNFREGTCEVCGKTYVREYLPAAEHVFPTVAELVKAGDVGDADCINGSGVNAKCKNCAETKWTAIPALGHDYYGWKYGDAATCTNDMIAWRYCKECNYKDEKVIEEALGHNWIIEAGTDATCTEDGKGTRICTRCKGQQNNVTIPAKGHDMTKKVETVAPTCTEQGYTVYTCATCGKGEEKGAYTAATGHKNYEVTGTVAPSCGVAGSITKACADCGKTVTEKVEALSHEYSWVVVSKPSEAGNGRNEYKCGKCGDVAEVKTVKYSKYYYNNTMTSFGPSTRELVGGNDWYRVTPVDVTVDGVYTYDLIASNKYVVGTVTITVNAGTLTVDYKVGANVDVNDESLLIYASKADLAAGSAVTAPVGAAINVAETFGADAKVLVSLILTGDYDAAGKSLVDEAAAAALVANID